jgi:hypothetical protein
MFSLIGIVCRKKLENAICKVKLDAYFCEQHVTKQMLNPIKLGFKLLYFRCLNGILLINFYFWMDNYVFKGIQEIASLSSLIKKKQKIKDFPSLTFL